MFLSVRNVYANSVLSVDMKFGFQVDFEVSFEQALSQIILPVVQQSDPQDGIVTQGKERRRRQYLPAKIAICASNVFFFPNFIW